MFSQTFLNRRNTYGKRIFFRHLDHPVAGEQDHDHKKYNINRGRCSRDQACSKKAGKQDHYKNPINQKSCSQCALIHFLQIFQLLYTDIFQIRNSSFPRFSAAVIFRSNICISFRFRMDMDRCVRSSSL